MTREQATEQRWLRRGIGTLLLLALALFVVTTYSVIQTSNDRAAAADRAERTAAELHVLADRLDAQAAALDRQAAALEEQAGSLQSSADRADQSRSQFREAAREILEQLGSDIDAFEEPTPSVEPAPVPHGTSAADRTTEPTPEPSPDPSPSPTEVQPGCQSQGTGPPRCRDG